MLRIFLLFLIGVLAGCSDGNEFKSKPIKLTYIQDCSQCPKMVVIPPGEYMMGSATKTAFAKDALPQTKITISYSLAVGQFEVTWQEYLYCLQDNYCTYRPDPEPEALDHPVNRVNYYDALKYAQWLSEKTGETYRLPSEAEWEYFARAGTITQYYWGDDFDPRFAYSWRAFPDDVRDGFPLINPVGKLKPNNYGLFDVIGNLHEWTNDCWNNSYVGRPLDGSAWTDGDCDLRMYRGGDTTHEPLWLRVWVRRAIPVQNLHPVALESSTVANDGSITYSGNRSVGSGFRVVRELKKQGGGVSPKP